jgi:hypothetical protein
MPFAMGRICIGAVLITLLSQGMTLCQGCCTVNFASHYAYSYFNYQTGLTVSEGPTLLPLVPTRTVNINDGPDSSTFSFSSPANVSVAASGPNETLAEASASMEAGVGSSFLQPFHPMKAVGNGVLHLSGYLAPSDVLTVNMNQGVQVSFHDNLRPTDFAIHVAQINNTFNDEGNFAVAVPFDFYYENTAGDAGASWNVTWTWNTLLSLHHNSHAASALHGASGPESATQSWATATMDIEFLNPNPFTIPEPSTIVVSTCALVSFLGLRGNRRSSMRALV